MVSIPSLIPTYIIYVHYVVQVTWYFTVEGFFYKVVASPLRLLLVSSQRVFYFDFVSLILMKIIIIILLLALKNYLLLKSCLYHTKDWTNSFIIINWCYNICTILSLSWLTFLILWLFSPKKVLASCGHGILSPYFAKLTLNDLLKVHVLVRDAIYFRTWKLEEIYEVIF